MIDHIRELISTFEKHNNIAIKTRPGDVAPHRRRFWLAPGSVASKSNASASYAPHMYYLSNYLHYRKISSYTKYTSKHYYNYYTRLMASFPGKPGYAGINNNNNNNNHLTAVCPGQPG